MTWSVLFFYAYHLGTAVCGMFSLEDCSSRLITPNEHDYFLLMWLQQTESKLSLWATFSFSGMMFHLVIYNICHIFSSRSGCKAAAHFMHYVFISCDTNLPLVLQIYRGSLIAVCGHTRVSPLKELDWSLIHGRVNPSKIWLVRIVNA